MKITFSFICVVLLGLVSVSCTLFSPSNGIYLIPAGYKGDIIIFFNQPDGVVSDVENGLLVYRIPENGILKIKTEGVSKTANKSYYYLVGNNERQEIKYLRITGDRDSSGKPKDKFDGAITQEEYANGVFVMNTGGLGSFQTPKGVVQFTSFIIGNPKDGEAMYDKMEKRITEIQRQMIKTN